jgi:class 3 adenylate cyclase/tetratricopeptide (TPR) repeat protein
MRCQSCGTWNDAENSFCGGCGSALAIVCGSCGVPAPPGRAYCGRCGAMLAPGGNRRDGPHSRSGPLGVTETQEATPVGHPTQSGLRWASVLFVDLVAYTPLTSGWDPEDVRELLTGYFEVADIVVERYGGKVEKFIGDAVVAAWGAESSREDDAARCVRAGLEIVQAVAEYGHQRGLSTLTARGGIVTGQVASWAGVNTGLLAGDRVNLAARIQSAAEPGTVLVEEVTMRATQSTVAFADAGEHSVKGVATPIRLWRAQRIVGGARGAQRADGLEASFIGRDRELAFAKQLFHATAEGGRIRLVAVSGVAGVGKTRLAREFQSYLDGLAGQIFLHRGRCPSYGDGVAFWALAEMVRQRFGIAEDADAEVAVASIARDIATWVPDADERDFVEPRLAVLVGASDRGFSREDLFAGWRLFLERLARLGPVVLVVEDLHWGDAGLFDFLEYLLDWSAAFPIYILTLARPDLAERRPAWLADRGHATALHLDPLPDPAIRQLLEELVPNLPEQVIAKITAQAAGIPLYAVETTRSLVDQELVVRRDGVYRLEGDVDALVVPASLTALIAARIDAMPTDERELVKSLAVLGESFLREAVTAVTEAPGDLVDEQLKGLVRKEVLSVSSDPLSQRRDQYAFVQAMLRSVAHDLLSRRERKQRHKAVADHLKVAFPDGGADVAEVIAAHLFDALTAAGSDADAAALQSEAEEAYDRAGLRAASVGSPDTAANYYQLAAGLTTDEEDRTRHIESAALMAERAGRPFDALELLQSAADAHRAAGRDVAAARLATNEGWIRLNYTRAGEETVRRLEEALQVLEREHVAEALPELHVVLGAALTTVESGRAAAAQHVESGLILAVRRGDHAALMAALHTKAELLIREYRVVEAKAHYQAVIDLAREHEDMEFVARAGYSLGHLESVADLPEAAARLEAALVISDRLGIAPFVVESEMSLGLLQLFLGRWDEAERCTRRAVDTATKAGLPEGLLVLVLLHAARGELVEADTHLTRLEAFTDTAESVSFHRDLAQSLTAFARHRFDQAAETAGRVAQRSFRRLGMLSDDFRIAWPLALEAAVSAHRSDTVASLLALVSDAPRAHRPPYIEAQLARCQALVGPAEGGDHTAVEPELRRALEIFDHLGYPYWKARTQSDLAQWLRDRRRTGEADALFAEATEVFTQLRALPDLDRVGTLKATSPG